MENDPNRYGPPPAAKSAINKLKQINLLEFKNSNIDCSVCLTKFSESLI